MPRPCWRAAGGRACGSGKSRICPPRLARGAPAGPQHPDRQDEGRCEAQQGDADPDQDHGAGVHGEARDHCARLPAVPRAWQGAVPRTAIKRKPKAFQPRQTPPASRPVTASIAAVWTASAASARPSAPPAVSLPPMPRPKRNQRRHQHQPGAVRGGHGEGPERQPGMPCGARAASGRAARQVNHARRARTIPRQGLQPAAIHGQAERPPRRHQRDGCKVPDGDRHQRAQRLRAVARTQAPGSGPIQPLAGFSP